MPTTRKARRLRQNPETTVHHPQYLTDNNLLDTQSNRKMWSKEGGKKENNRNKLKGDLDVRSSKLRL